MMKTRFDTYDLVASVAELQRLIGMRVNQIYDIDHRTYLIRLQRSEEKCVLLLESGNRIHTTAFEWPKNVAPSGFSMKLRKHLKNKRLESLAQIGTDRMVDLQFGSDEAAYHVILEVYDRGNIILTDYQLTILNVLRPHTEGDKVRFVVREKYPTDRAHTTTMSPRDVIESRLATAKSGDPLKKVLNPLLEFGSALIEHALLKTGFPSNCKIGKTFKVDQDLDKLWSALQLADEIMENAKFGTSKGYITQKKEAKPTSNDNEEFIMANLDFHPVLLEQFKNQPYKEFDSFDLAVDEYFSMMEGQKLDLKALAQEREVMKKLDNVRKDHNQRLEGLGKVQEVDKKKAELITRNQVLVDHAIIAVQSAIATQMPWPDIELLVKQAQARGDPIACAINKLKLEINHISLHLTDPYAALDDETDETDDTDEDDDDNDNDGDDDDDDDENNHQHKMKQKNKKDEKLEPMIIDVDLDLSAFANATKYYGMKRSAAKKHQKTIESHSKALKNAERKTKQTLKEVKAIHSINKARKVYWFEKFYWFITSENYLVIGGRDQQQNELIVKRYLRSGDLYVHADLTGASSVVLKNPSGLPVPPKSLSEAGTMAVAYSVAWDAKVIAGAYWVYHDQVSKTAPTGEYLSTGSFMIRGKKNFLPPCQLVMGLSFLFRLEESSIERHLGERKIRTLEDDESIIEGKGDVASIADAEDEIVLNDGSDHSNDDDDVEDNAKSKQITRDPEDENSEDGEDDEDDEDDSDNDVFPNTEIKYDITGSGVKIVADDKSYLNIENDEQVVYLGDDKPVILKPSIRKNQQHQKSTVNFQVPEKLDDSKQLSSKTQKRQKTKLKKIKEKYKNQDEEDRQIIMEMLKPNAVREARKIKRNKKFNQRSNSNKDIKKKGRYPSINDESKRQINTGDNIELDDDPGPAPEVDMLNQLTGKPVDEDELLFAVPVIAPYNAVTSSKFKVKLTPGTGRRGKAVKLALAAFIRDKTITMREKDLLKAVKEENIARNIPGKVKLTAPAIQKLKKHK